MSGLEPLFSFDEVADIYGDFIEETVDKTVESLSYIGEMIVNDMRKSGEYTDRTGNLRSSVGYIVANDGAVRMQNFQSVSGDEGGQGIKEAKKYAREILSEFSEGLVLIVFAGMEYAAAVESRGYDVITGSVDRAGNIADRLKKLIDEN